MLSVSFLSEKKGTVDNKEAYNWFHLAAENGDGNAQCNVGHCYSSGNGVEKNMAEAIFGYKKSAEHGNDEAAYSLGKIYIQDIKDASNNSEQAFHWFYKAASNGHFYAQYSLGKCYELGLGVEKMSNLHFFGSKRLQSVVTMKCNAIWVVVIGLV